MSFNIQFLFLLVIEVLVFLLRMMSRTNQLDGASVPLSSVFRGI